MKQITVETIKLLFSIILFLLHITWIDCANAQLYKDLKKTCNTIELNGETYVMHNYIDLFTVIGNTKDEFLYSEILLRDGTIPPNGHITRQRQPIDITKTQAQRLSNIIDNSFNKEQVVTLEDREIIIHVNVSTATGIPTGVTYTYYNDSGYETIPMDVWQEIETQIMGEFCFSITEIGKTLNHCDIVWAQCPRGKEDSGLTIEGVATLPNSTLHNPLNGKISTPSVGQTIP